MIYTHPYTDILNNVDSIASDLVLQDHLGGFDIHHYNLVLDKLNKNALARGITYNVIYHNILDKSVLDCYPNLNITFSAKHQNQFNLDKFVDYNMHPELDYKNFVCSFNGTSHVSRKLVTSILHKFNWFDPDYCSKNFSYSVDALEGHISDLVGDRENFYRKFFISRNSDDFFQTVYTFGHIRYQHGQNIHNLEKQITQSFVHLVSETLATSHVPFVTEKFLYSIVTRGLFLTYAQPGWHKHLQEFYGFRLYDKLFDYRFDSIVNPVERLVELTSMLSKFSQLTPAEWNDLYLMESDSIEYNYNHYFSQDYLKCLESYEY